MSGSQQKNTNHAALNDKNLRRISAFRQCTARCVCAPGPTHARTSSSCQHTRRDAPDEALGLTHGHVEQEYFSVDFTGWLCL
eukprot:m.1046580 g.1046580  ORF g.1046580 m.1046580 type:complete len:82 (-) comp24170_c0_seq130:2578-2823(-)